MYLYVFDYLFYMYLYIQIEESPSINFCLQVDGLPTRLGTSEEVGRRQPESDLQDLLGNNGCLNNMELGNSIGNLLVFFFFFSHVDVINICFCV